MPSPRPIFRPALGTLAGLMLGTLTGLASAASAPAAPTPLSIAQLPLTIAIPAHPQIVIAIGNSESMDGNLGGAIMTGSGSLTAGDSLLQSSSSPVNFSIPAGFTPPLDAGSSGSAPYTVTSGGNLVDNSPSRLNVAKSSITAMLNAFMPDADFAMLDYKTSGLTLYNTWLYEMSPTASGFVFASSQLAGNRYVANPCYNYTSLAATNTVYKDCLAIDGSGQVTGSVASSQYMQISASSDDPLINDVLYAGSEAPVCLVYGGPNPASPYTGYALSDYNSNPGNVRESYSHEINSCATATGPTNAGFVPYTPQTMYIQRGFGYGASQSATAATTLVSMTSAGSTPTAGTVATAIAKFTPFLAPETNSTSTTEIKASAGQSALPGLLKGANSYYSTANPPSSNGCAAKRYVILLTDGLPTLDLAGHSWPPPGTTSATNWGETVAFNADGSLSAAGTNDQAVIDTINQLAALNSGSSPVQTYVIGLGAGVDPTQNPTAANVLKAMAIAGGTSNYYAATSPTALTNDLQGIIVNILAATQSTASTAVSATSLRSGSTAYLVQFTTSDTYQDWTGDVIAYPIDPATGAVNTTPSAATWDAKTQLDTQDWDTGRIIATWDPVAGQGTPFRWNSALAPDGISATTGLGEALSTFSSDTNGSDVLNYLRGSSTLEQRNGGTFRNRAHKLGDIVDSAPLYVGAPSSASQSSSYFTFAAAHASRAPLIYIGANDGMLHAFDAATGKERFAYVPNGVFNNLINLPNPYYNASHLFFVNGSPQAADVQFASDSSWHTVLAGTEGAGGHSVFALDITSADGITTEAQLAADVLWEFTDADMGLTYSAPAFANTSAGWLVLFGNGYNSTKQKPILYALDPQKGTVVAKIDLCAAVATACDSTLANGLSSVAVVNSYGNVSGAANTVYAGDLQGNVWRVDITNSDPSQWQVRVLYQTQDASGNRQPITTAPAVTLNPEFPQLPGTMVVVGTGQLLGFPDLTTTQVQTLYGIFDPPTGSASPLGFSGIPTRSNMVGQTLANSTVDGASGPVSVRVEPTVNPVNLPTSRGWYIDLSLATGERVVTNPQIESGGGVVVTTYQPNSAPCSSGGNSWLMVLNYATGGSFPAPMLDANGDGKLNTADQTSDGLNAVGLSLGGVYASEPTIVQKSCTGNNCGSKETQLSNGSVLPVGEAGGITQRNAWWEVRQ
jgi:type IV pilus assembly protein PilY1